MSEDLQPVVYQPGDQQANTVPAFLSKLWVLVSDPSSDDLIHWDQTGQSFHIHDQGRFARTMLPQYFKHRNIASFIRQLNMYGFRKVTSVEQGGLKSENDDLEFQHHYFMQGSAYLLEHIKRKISIVRPEVLNTQTGGDAATLPRVLIDVKQLQGKQETMNLKFESMKRENEALWREVASLRQKHMKQQTIVNKLIQFLVSCLGSGRVAVKRKPPALMMNKSSTHHIPAKTAKYSPQLSIEEHNRAYTVESPRDGPIIHDVTDTVNGLPEQLLTENMQDKTMTSSTTTTTPSASVLISELNSSPTADRNDELALLPCEFGFDSSLYSIFGSGNSGDVDDSVLDAGGGGLQGTGSNDQFLNINKHVDTMQADLDGLRDLLGTIPLENNTFSDLFSDNKDGDYKEQESSLHIEGHELIQYLPPSDDTSRMPNLFDGLTDDDDGLDLATLADINSSNLHTFDDTTLNTPIIESVPLLGASTISADELD